jgi:hypothetical protein
MWIRKLKLKVINLRLCWQVFSNIIKTRYLNNLLPGDTSNLLLRIMLFPQSDSAFVRMVIEIITFLSIMTGSGSETFYAMLLYESLLYYFDRDQ